MAITASGETARRSSNKSRDKRELQKTTSLDFVPSWVGQLHNPAVTFGLLLSGKFEAKDVPGYFIAQIAGAIIAASVLLVIAGGTSAGYDPATAGFAANGYGAHSPDGYNLTAAFVAEVVLTFFLVFTVLGSTDIKAPVGFAGIPIGIVLVLIHLVGIPGTNTSVNIATQYDTSRPIA
jgi:aquaporin Z